MNFEFAQKIIPALEKHDHAGALAIAEKAMSKIPASPYHAVLGKSLLHEAGSLAGWIEGFYGGSRDQISVKALYFELNEFDINTDRWYIDGFAYEEDGGLSGEDMEWLVNWQTDTQKETGTIFVIQGYEDLQEAFAAEGDDGRDMQDARDWCEQIVITRFMELMRRAHAVAKEQGMGWAAVPVYFTEHAYDFIVRSQW